MMSSPIYVPIIKGKLNDLRAVGGLQPEIRDRIKPLIEAMPVNPKTSATVEEHVFKLCDYIRRHAPLGEVFVDFYGLMPDAVVDDGVDATLHGYRLLKAFGRSVTPVYGLERNDQLWQPLGDVVRGFGKGFAFRLRRDDLADYVIDDTWEQIVVRLAEMKLSASETDLVLDFGSLSGTENSDVAEQFISFLWHNPHIRTYRSVIIAASSALRTVSDVEKDNMAEINREELHLWSALWRDMPDEMKPIYGDYGVIHPDFSDLGPNKYMNAKIRYTAGDKILYFRGHGLLHPVKDYDQYHRLADLVRSDRRYQGRRFSFGDAYINDCAARLIRHGAPATWVKADMNHHLTYATRQISRLLPAFVSESSDKQAAVLLATV